MERVEPFGTDESLILPSSEELRERLLPFVAERLALTLEVVQNPKNDIHYILDRLRMNFEELHAMLFVD